MEFRCGVIGLGRMGCGFDDKPNITSINTHAGSYFLNKNAKLVTLCDIDKNKLLKYGKKYNVSNTYLDYKKMFQESRLDCISICTLADSHLDIVNEAVKHKVKGIFLEKPISNSLKSAKEIIDICNKNNIKLQIDFQRRFDPLYHSIKNIVTSKKFGKVQHCSIYYGAGIANTGSHFIDLARFFFGDISYVKGNYSQNSSNNLSDPNIEGKIIFKNNTICSIIGLDVNGENYGIFEFDIFGSGGRIRINLAKHTAEFFEISDKIGLAFKELALKSAPIPVRKEPIVLGVENLFDSIENNNQPLSTGIDGYSSLECIMALMDSADNKSQESYLPLKTDTYKISSK